MPIQNCETFQRLKGLELGKENSQRVLTFVTCVCLRQNEYFVNFSFLISYMKELPITQQQLQMMNVLSVFFPQGPMAKRIHRIYEDMRHKSDCAKPLEKIGTNDEVTPLKTPTYL